MLGTAPFCLRRLASIVHGRIIMVRLHSHWPTPTLSTSEKAQLRATSLYLIRIIVKRHGGTIEIDLASNTIIIDVPEEEQAVCAQEIEQQVSVMRG